MSLIINDRCHQSNKKGGFMKNFLPKLTPSEFEIMNVIWERNELTITEIMKAVNSRAEKKLTRSTIQVQVGRLEEKGWLKHSENGKKFLFYATVPRGDASAAIVHDLNERVFGGSCAELIKSLLGGRKKISSNEIRKIRDLIDEYEDEES
jgi:predicted transcriptional regulator